MNATNYPGTWQEYIKRPDNLGLPISTVTRKYLRESEIFNRQLFEALQQSPFSVNTPPSSGGGIPEKDNLPSNCIEFVVNTAYDTYFEFNVSSATQDFEYTITWGDGVIEDGSSGEGSVYLNHTYPEANTAYIARMCFSDPTIINNINFPGFD